MSGLPKFHKEAVTKKKEDAPFELESQFILRLPHEPAEELRKAVKLGANNLKDRLSIQLENDVRHGTVRFDNYIWSAKLVDLPSIVESLKTIDRKTFYKTADICQMLTCNEEDDPPSPEEDETVKKNREKKDVPKVDKKYLWPHGITPPLKNVRKRRFRKTLKKKVVDAPEIEKEVKRLFRVDNEAVNVKWEVIMDEEDGLKQKSVTGEGMNSSVASPAISGPLFSNSQSLDIAEHDIFGDVVTSSEDEVDVNIVDSADDDGSRLSSSNMGRAESKDSELLVTHFSKQMLHGSSSPTGSTSGGEGYSTPIADHIQTALDDAGITKKELGTEDREALLEKLEELRRQLMDVNTRRQAQEQEIASIENQALKQRFRSLLNGLIAEEKEKQQEYEDVAALLQRR